MTLSKSTSEYADLKINRNIDTLITSLFPPNLAILTDFERVPGLHNDVVRFHVPIVQVQAVFTVATQHPAADQAIIGWIFTVRF